MRSFGCATLRAAPLRMTERARFARNQKSLARGKITLLPQRTQFAENLRLLRKSECGARINLRSPERRAAERKHDAEPPRGEHRVVSPNHGKKFCLFQNFFRELQSGFPSLSRKSQHLFCEICAKPRITRAWQNHTFA